MTQRELADDSPEGHKHQTDHNVNGVDRHGGASSARVEPKTSVPTPCIPSLDAYRPLLMDQAKVFLRPVSGDLTDKVCLV